MSRIRANQITNKTADGATTATNGFNVTGVCTATSFSGDGSGLTGLSGVTLSGSTNNQLVTVTGANALTGESTLSFDSSTDKLALTGSDSYVNIGPNSNRFEIRNNNYSSYLYHYGGGTLHFALAGSATQVQFDSISQVFAQFNKGGSCNLYYNNSRKFETTNTGASIIGDLSVSGVLTYEDVTNVDSVGIVTARAGIRVTGDVIEAQAGENKIPALYADLASLPSASTYHGMFAHVHATGRGYFSHAGNWLELINKDTNGVLGFTGGLKEQVNIIANHYATNYPSPNSINLEDGMVHYFTGTGASNNQVLNIKFSNSVSLNTIMSVGETVSVTVMVTQNNTSGYVGNIQIDGANVVESWIGGSAPTDGSSSGIDIYTFNIIKTANATFTTIANQNKTT